MVKIPLELGANPNIATKKGINPFMSAAYLNLCNFFILLSQYDGNLEQKDEKGLNIRMIAGMPRREKTAMLPPQINQRKSQTVMPTLFFPTNVTPQISQRGPSRS